MKLTEVVAQLQLVLPKYTGYFSNTLNITSIVAVGGVATITAPNHGLSNNVPVTISNVAQNTPIDSVSQDGLIFTFGTSENHDLTFDYPGYENVNLDGFTDTSWNGAFKLMDVPDRATFKVQSTETIPTLQGAEYLKEIRIDGINGRYAITFIDADNFSVSGDFKDGDYSEGTIKTGVRIAGSVSIERAIDQYTEHESGELWMFVVMNDAVTSKNRTAENDSTATIAANEDIRTRLVDGFSVFIMKTVKDEIAAVQAVDIARHDLLGPICKSLFGARFSTGLSGAGDFSSILTGHNFAEYKKAWFIYQYNFEFTSDLTLDDAVDETDTKAFSEIDYTQSVGGDDTEDLTISNLELR
jgi:hypothetical protein